MKSSKKRFAWDKVLGIVGLILVVLVAGYFGWWRPHQIKEEKKQFEKAQASIEQLYSQIEAKVGKPDQVKRENKCSYTSVEFGRGSRSCDVIIFGLYENRSTAQANELLKNII